MHRIEYEARNWSEEIFKWLAVAMCVGLLVIGCDANGYT